MYVVVIVVHVRTLVFVLALTMGPALVRGLEVVVGVGVGVGAIAILAHAISVLEPARVAKVITAALPHGIATHRGVLADIQAAPSPARLRKRLLLHVVDSALHGTRKGGDVEINTNAGGGDDTRRRSCSKVINCTPRRRAILVTTYRAH